jgi:hypothetical protein
MGFSLFHLESLLINIALQMIEKFLNI